MTETTFADRLWWARRLRGMGATRLARAVGCAQGLISSLERKNAEHSRYGIAFAKALGVDAGWLATGDGQAPDGWNAKEARDGRKAMTDSDDPAKSISVVKFHNQSRWSAGVTEEPNNLDALQKRMINDFMDFARQAGTERTTALLEMFSHVRALAVFQSAEGKK